MKKNDITLVFSMIWLTDILNIQIEEQPSIKYYIIKHLILLKIQNMMDISVVT